MPHRAYLRTLPPLSNRRCECCGADKSTNYIHTENCLLNLPGKFADLAPYWKKGQKNGFLLPCATEPQKKAFQMGQQSAAGFAKQCA